jgi:hypothetical protein
MQPPCRRYVWVQNGSTRRMVQISRISGSSLRQSILLPVNKCDPLRDDLILGRECFVSLIGFVMILFTFLIAYRFNRSRTTDNYLPTPFQLSLFFHAKNGSLGSFWSLGRYLRWEKREKREKLGGMVIETCVMLFTIILLRLAGNLY